MRGTREVWKYKVPVGEVHGANSTISMPEGAQIVSVGTQWAEVWVWAIVDPQRPRVERRLGYFATGGQLPDWDYVGTAHIIGRDPLAGSAYVWHVFEDPDA
jgi:hypothetical protein